MIVTLDVKLYLVLITILQPNCQNIYRGGGPVRFPQQDPDLIHPPFPCQRGSDITPPHPNPKWNFSSWSKIFSFWTKLVRITFSFLDPIFLCVLKMARGFQIFFKCSVGHNESWCPTDFLEFSNMNHGAQLFFFKLRSNFHKHCCLSGCLSGCPGVCLSCHTFLGLWLVENIIVIEVEGDELHEGKILSSSSTSMTISAVEGKQ